MRSDVERWYCDPFDKLLSSKGPPISIERYPYD